MFVLILGCFVLLPNLEQEPFFCDEAMWLKSGCFAFETYFIEKSFYDPLWESGFSSFGWHNPQVGKFVVGAGPFLDGICPELAHINWQFGRNERAISDNLELGNLPTLAALAAGRRGPALLGILSALLIYAITASVAGRLSGLLAATLFLCNPLVHHLFRLAMLDGPAIFFGMLAVGACLMLVRSSRTGANAGLFYWSGIAGLAAGLAVGSKLTAFWACLPLAACLSLIFIVSILKKVLGKRMIASRPHPRSVLLAGILSICFFLTGFIATNPFIYQDPVQKIFKMRNYWQDQQHLRLESMGNGLDNPRDRLWHINHRMIIPGMYAYGSRYESLRRGIDEIKLQYRASSRKDNRYPDTVNQWDILYFGPIGKYGVVNFDQPLFLLGLFGSLLFGLIRLVRRKPAGEIFLLIFWWAAAYGSTASWLYLDVPRYYLQVVGPLIVLVVLGVYYLLTTPFAIARLLAPIIQKRFVA